MSELSNYLQEARGDLSIDQVVEHAARRGHKISRITVDRLTSGRHGPRPSEASLAAMAAALDLDLRHLRELAGRPGGELGPYVPTPAAGSLTKRQRDALDALIVTMVEGGTGDVGNTRQKMSGGATLSVVPDEGERTAPNIHEERKAASRPSEELRRQREQLDQD